MLKKTPHSEENSTELKSRVRFLQEGALIGLIMLCAYLALALFSYSPLDPAWSSTGDTGEIRNAGGPAGAWIADVFLSLFGSLAYLFPLLLAYQAWMQIRNRARQAYGLIVFMLRAVGFILVMAAGTGACSHAIWYHQ